VTQYIIRRILVAIPTLLAVFTFAFLVVRVVPGDPALAILGDQASAATLEQFRERMGLNQPLPMQYLSFLWRLLQGDLGRSVITGMSINHQLALALPKTLELTGSGVLIGLVLGIPLGILAAIFRNTWLDYLIRLFSLAGLSVPAFVLGILLIVWFALGLRWFPVISTGSGATLAEYLRQLFLPAMTLGLIMTAYITRITRSSLLNVFHEDYIRTARSKGVSERQVVAKHALRNGLIPIVTLVGLYTGVLIGSSVMTEIVFNRPGLGGMIVGAMAQRDYNVLQSLLVVFASLVVLINLLTDLLYGVVDPRIRYD